MSKVLFIGGTHAGETIEVEDGTREVRLSVRRIGFQRQVGGVPPEEVYFLGELSDATGIQHSVFVHDGEDAVLVLMRYYQNKTR